jgi:hypothetical protein
MTDGRHTAARVVGIDPTTDVATSSVYLVSPVRS